MEENLKKYIEELISEIQNELDEATVTGNIAGYQTPNAFSDKGSSDKNRKKKMAKRIGYTLAGKVDESFMSDLDIIKKGSKDITDFVKKVLSDKQYKEVRTDKDFHKYLKSFYNESVEYTSEAYKGEFSDFKYEFGMALDNMGISPKAIKKISKKGKGFEVRMSSYMNNKTSWEKLGNTMGVKLIDFKPGSINIGLYESIVTESKDEVNPKQLANLQRDIKKINPKIKVYISNHPVTKGKLQIELGSDHPSNQGDDREITKINALLKKHTGDWRTGTMFTESKVNEAKVQRPVNRWLELKNDDSMTANKKMAKGLKELKYQLAETEKFFNWYNKIKNINELDSDNYWKRTNKHIYKIKERLINIAKTIQEIEK